MLQRTAHATTLKLKSHIYVNLFKLALKYPLDLKANCFLTEDDREIYTLEVNKGYFAVKIKHKFYFDRPAQRQ